MPGTYVWRPDFGGCAVLGVGHVLTYHYDQECDGGPDYIGRDVRLEDSQLVIDDATLALEQADATRILGTYTYGSTFAAEFVRI